MKPSEIRDLKTEEIQTKLADAREELMNLRFQQVNGQLTDTSRLRAIRRDIARYLTLLGERAAETEGVA
ncbi:MAG: 50S ribosomal protein L29 [Anaerolineales bacterium]|nr:50S ribosomal protein L29 [Anaerolineales bacterium]